MHKPDWHCIVMDNARNIEIDGITCIVRSRTWQIQMRDSEHIGYYNIKVIGGNPSDANQDGMDWLGGGYTTIRNSFSRASDDDFALEGNWDGYSQDAMLTPGHDVHNITIEDSIASTSISNTIRVNWPQKTFNSAHFLMRNMDVIHTGFGACKVPSAFLSYGPIQMAMVFTLTIVSRTSASKTGTRSSRYASRIRRCVTSPSPTSRHWMVQRCCRPR